MKLVTHFRPRRQLLVAAALSCAAACKPQDRPEPTLSCREYDEYEYELIDPSFWFGFGDNTPGAYDGREDGRITRDDNGNTVRPPAPDEQTLDEPICGNSAVDFYKTYGHNDWGSAWGRTVRNKRWSNF